MSISTINFLLDFINIILIGILLFSIKEFKNSTKDDILEYYFSLLSIISILIVLIIEIILTIIFNQ